MGTSLLSLGLDSRFRVFSTVTDYLNRGHVDMFYIQSGLHRPRHLPSRRQPHTQAPGVRLGHREPQPADRDGGHRGHRQVQVWQAAEQAPAQGRDQLRPSELVL